MNRLIKANITEFFLMSGKRYPIILVLKSNEITGCHGETLFHVIAKHEKHGSFCVDCSSDEIVE